MNTSTVAIVVLALALGTGVTPPIAAAAGGEDKSVVTVAFGVGLNTALPPPNGEPNHHILPGIIKVKAGGVVNFVVSGLHQVYVYNPGVTREDLIVPLSGFFVNSHDGPIAPGAAYYRGIVPAGGPLGLPSISGPRSNADNRVEAVSFKEPGIYLVICNVRPHLLDGMYAYIKVLAPDEDE